VDDEDILEEGLRRRVYWTMQLKGLNLTETEQRAGLSRGTLSMFLSGRRGPAVTKRWLLKLGTALDLDYGWMITGQLPDPSRAHPELALPPIPTIPRGRPAAGSSFVWVAKKPVKRRKP
jgi:transcriptional regulator with XRE-family HTH domain